MRLRAFREALLIKIWWLGAYKYFIGPVLSYWLTVRLSSTDSTNSLQEASILFQHIIPPQIIVLFVEFKSFPPHLRTFLSNFVATDVYALLLKSYPEDFRPILSWVSSNPILGRNLSTTPAWDLHVNYCFLGFSHDDCSWRRCECFLDGLQKCRQRPF